MARPNTQRSCPTRTTGPESRANAGSGELLADAETKFDEAKEGWNEYRAKVDAQDEAIGALYEFGSLLVQQMRVAARKDGTNQLYQLAQIDPPKPATPRTEAPIPTNLTTTNTTSGDIELSFKGSKAGGAQQAQATAETDGGETLTIEDAQALKDAQTAKGADKAG